MTRWWRSPCAPFSSPVSSRSVGSGGNDEVQTRRGKCRDRGGDSRLDRRAKARPVPRAEDGRHGHHVAGKGGSQARGHRPRPIVQTGRAGQPRPRSARQARRVDPQPPADARNGSAAPKKRRKEQVRSIVHVSWVGCFPVKHHRL